VTVPGPAFEDRFERDEVGPDWWSAGGPWLVRGGELRGAGTRNNPLWLRMRLPVDVAVEFTARSETATGSRPGDVKIEIFGNGRDHASGYVLVFGGWGNATSVIARLDELEAHSAEAMVMLVGLPPLSSFPLLPQPLRAVMGIRARMFDEAAKFEVSQRQRVVHVPIDTQLAPEQFSPDGFHPPPSSYSELGRQVAAAIFSAKTQSGRSQKHNPSNL